MNVTDTEVSRSFIEVYTKFKLQICRDVFGGHDEEPSSLTTVESLCMEVISAMERPTINEFATYIGISQPNAAYKVNSLIRKGYLKKIRSVRDKREYFLEVTDKYREENGSGERYLETVLERLNERLAPEEAEALAARLNLISSELMPEIPSYRKRMRE